ncbi:MAG: DnaA regulatory inactivator Hda [Betaproteobacteria bacterium]|nr:DnaA regulatory inactivator Hda [Betaproteobacteria bacterium]
MPHQGPSAHAVQSHARHLPATVTAPVILKPTQILLPLLQVPVPTLASFVTGPNGEALAAVQALLAGEHDGEPVYLWGDHASGRSHLLRGFVCAAAVAAGDAGGRVGSSVSAEWVDAATVPGDWSPPGPVLVVDDVDQLSADAQVRLFDAINRGRAEGWRMLFAGPLPPARLTLRGELSSRLAQGLVLQLEHLTDLDKAAAMTDYAARAGFELPPEVSDYLLRHGRRDLGTLLAVVRAIDEVSLRDRRPVTVRLAHDLLYSADLFCPV